MSGYLRTDISCWKTHNIFIIPTIEFCKSGKYVEISFNFLCFTIYIVFSYINIKDYEP